MSVPHPDGPEAPRSLAPDGAEPALSPDAPVADPPRPAPWHGQAPVVAVVAAGGGIGATARYGASLLWPTGPAGFPWTTFWVNVVGCFVIGLFMIVITEGRPVHRLVRPFFGTGVLGGFTTFSTYAVDIQRLMEEGRPGTALAYLGATLLAALGAVWLAAATARRLPRTGPTATPRRTAPPASRRTGPAATREKGKRSS
ncbi:MULTISPECIES: fluoride efflux transporter CrcB [Streptomyces]|uniref:fluoride efflux transporter CrcB n=1 Tax=Streptomyces TaxID=1883 RepID=UPI000BCF6371|nr:MULTISPECIES: fluoride efflux transporter CrcB [Streptomyces]MDX2551108.1 fluoride efflux transporter CrcB [Streptomyces stelliscabiei]MDX2614895.1 fluoride efflux transporter CrcB [Streptomyces stelliscabiei]MDX2635505.1 fluoride efflux transporter CrcB [Streptomyces stelliscabiei]MDX2667766.1 fluoride efflux transporter CrcB [Streptomyces stelliscabiei]MDX2718540.1 fluoride efflux transporter CrcB [Streptomyces stelliscabiei]